LIFKFLDSKMGYLITNIKQISNKTIMRDVKHLKLINRNLN
jgi:hypothetical protein